MFAQLCTGDEGIDGGFRRYLTFMSQEQQLRPGTWSIDTLHSQVGVSVWHFNVANLRAKFPGVTGSLEVDAANPLRSTLQVEIDAASVLTGHPRQEEFMRSEPWLDAERFPRITFTGTGIEARDNGFVVGGELTLKGVIRQLEIPFDFHGVVSDPWGLRAGFTSQFPVDRRDFGISWDRVFDWGVMAGHELTFSLDIELAYPDPALAQAPH
jgi:polyisoprenoid-binding protein YceI